MEPDPQGSIVLWRPGPASGGKTILELWVPAEELDDLNAHLVGPIDPVHEFR